MFHAARALLYSQEFREKSHYCLGIALRALFVETGKLSVEFLEAFNNAMSLVNVKIKMYQLWSNKNVPFIRLFLILPFLHV